MRPSRKALEMVVTGKRPRDTPKKLLKDTISKDMKEVEVSSDDTQDRVLWRRRISTADPQTRQTLRGRRDSKVLAKKFPSHSRRNFHSESRKI